MVHAKLGVAQENSGKLIHLVRTQARKIAVEEARDLILIDGPPGIGCPAIASITGSDLVLVVTEPTLSGVHDFSRVVDLTQHFRIETLLLINKWDLNAELTSKLEGLAQKRNVRVIGKIHFDKAITEAQIRKQSIVEYQQDGAAVEIKKAWTEISQVMDQQQSSLMEGHSSSSLHSTFPAPRSGRDKGRQKGWL
jgi:MinD superfamily P-loop ATPase